ncbi:hypothetical protein H9Q71_003137 [Fusarium xylarioides]|nr:hypothetical protein H9Q71_003137 [Fusarium xylarioides]
MHSSTTLLLIAATTVNAIGIRDDCKDVHIFLAKGNDEPYPGRQGKLAGAICSGLKSCDYEDIQFQNALEDPFCDSVTEGVKNGIKQITAYNKKCPDSKLVVSGYSQGGQVVGDILGGGGGVFFQNCVEPDLQGLNPKTLPGSKIVAAMVFGDTRHTKDQPYNVHSGKGKDGLFPRPAGMLENLASYGDVFRNYCVETDPICAKGDEVETHLNCVDVFTDDVAEWVKERVGEDATTTTAVTKTSTKEETETTTEAASTTKGASKEATTKDTTTTAVASTTADASSTADSTSLSLRSSHSR